jgi:hypothetical protein
MFEELNQKLIDVKQRIREKQKLEKTLQKLNEEKEREQHRLAELQKRLDNEEADVKRLERLSLTGLFHEILGTKDQKLKKEQQEFLAAKLKFDQCKHALNAIRRDIVYNENQSKKIGDPVSAYREILASKEELLTAAHHERLISISERLGDLKSDERELEEALAAGKAVLTELDKVIGSLKSAGNWGTFDLLGGGILATAVKHSRIDRARSSVHQVQQLLSRFRRELADVSDFTGFGLDVQIGSFTSFADYFFDGLIFDWIVQSKINKSLSSAQRLKGEVKTLDRALRLQLADLRQKIGAVMQEKREFLEEVRW